MIFGFNTDIKVDDTVYHVQSEARTAEKLLQTQVFVKGMCIGKRAVSYAEDEASGQTEETRHELLRTQHRNVVQAVREGRVDSVIQPASAKPAAPAPPVAETSQEPIPTPATEAPPEVQPAPEPPPVLELKFLSSIRPSEEKLLVRFSVEADRSAAEGAQISAQIVPDAKASATFSGSGATEGRTNRGGMVELSLPLPPNPQGEALLLVQVEFAAQTIAKKFRIKTKA